MKVISYNNIVMEFDQVVVKDGPGLCRCCLSEGCYKDLGTEYSWMSDTEVYADMLLECFDISISQHNEGPNGPKRLICEVCITRLRDACNFKKQVQDAEHKFVDMLAKGEFKPKVLILEANMKSEVLNDDLSDKDHAEYLDVDFDHNHTDDEMLGCVEDASTSNVEETPPPKKRGRPRKSPKETKKAKVTKLETKTRASKAVAKGGNLGSTPPEAESKSSKSAAMRYRAAKENVITLLQHSTAVPFKWLIRQYLCFYCHKQCNDIKELRRHTDTHKSPNIKSAVMYLKRDDKAKIDIMNLSCKICSDKFDEVAKLIAHLESHNVVCQSDLGYIPYRLYDDRFQCAVCGEKFEYFLKLNQHMNSHYGSCVCDECGKPFLSSQRLRSHKLTHTTGYPCTICDAKFDSAAKKNRHHATVHKKDITLKCLYCDERFNNYTQRKKHHNAAHDVKMSIFNCPECDKEFKIKSKMKVHLRSVHLKEVNFKCNICDHGFFSKNHLRVHMTKHTGEKAHVCHLCSKAYSRLDKLKDHLKKHDKK